ncbi:beta strand repeat-containing protein [Deinococcus yavapaiensis]|uniref:Putative repeat protein (TIGR01451 family) n=1 Tax=Deinococcus yavapaiensis KR-236 TaxID=694435 RepID=A0A318S5G5_9DEIO|nr:DUF11 domain-containing protein [Deinococcus yavapaiensis]PYE53354.1 putative repeat protein (TIGR01451 family) [Deinococcus yavapaiensis KR-236]
MKKPTLMLVVTGILALTACGQTGTSTNPPITNTTGTLTLTNPNGYSYVVRNGSGQVQNGTTLTPGSYTIEFSRAGFVTQTLPFTITAGQATSLNAPTLQAVTTSGGAFYVRTVNGAPQLTAIPVGTNGQVDQSRFRFFAWLQDVPNTGINLATPGAAAPTTAEQTETAPSRTQNLAAGMVMFSPDGTNYFPVVGADVRWNIVDRTGGTIFTAADDGNNAPGYSGGANGGNVALPLSIGAAGLQADTTTNRATGTNARFPVASGDFPLFNLTGVGSPDTDGFSWVTLFSPNANATAQVVAVASVGGTEIGKAVLNKTFAPSANLTITKTFDNGSAGLNQTRTATITITNTGQGPATGVQLQDRLDVTGTNAANYSIGTLPTGATAAQDNDGFNATFDLAAGASRTFTVPVSATSVGVYCDVATLVSYTNGAFGTVTPAANNTSRACLTVTAPSLTITKQFLDANGNVLGNSATVTANAAQRVRLTVTNNGNAPATNVTVAENLTRVNGTTSTGNNTAYSATLPTGATANDNDGFTATIANLAVGASQNFDFAVQANADGVYCDTGSFSGATGTTSQGISQEICLTVVTPSLSVTKVNTAGNQTTANNGTVTLNPGDTYTSTVTVRNTGGAAATGVNVQDLLARLGANGAFVNFGSGSYTLTGTTTPGTSTFNGGTNTASINGPVTIPAGGTLTFTLNSTIPAGAGAGQYCNVATVTSTNVVNINGNPVTTCVNVRAFSAAQTTLIDANDPVRAGGSTVYTATISNEQLSNENLRLSPIVFNFGTPQAGGANLFTVAAGATQVYLDPNPTRGANGAITSAPTAGQLLTAGTDYTVTAGVGGSQTVTLANTRTLAPGAALFIVTTVNVPSTITATTSTNSTFTGTATGVTSNLVITTSASEPTTVTP